MRGEERWGIDACSPRWLVPGAGRAREKQHTRKLFFCFYAGLALLHSAGLERLVGRGRLAQVNREQLSKAAPNGTIVGDCYGHRRFPL